MSKSQLDRSVPDAIKVPKNNFNGSLKKKGNINKPKTLPQINNITQTRVYSAYTKGRKNPREDYETPVSKREWWRVLVKETPVPGHYAYRDFLSEEQMNPIQATYNFAGQGRKHEPGISRKGTLLLPGLYQHKDFINELQRRRATYSFHSSGRAKTPPGFQDKDLNVPPWQYNTAEQLVAQKGTTAHPNGNSAFRSQSSRFPLNHFRPREGPPPGAYDPCIPVTRYAISSSFRSRMPRFSTAHTKVPGPGTYEASTQQTHTSGKIASSLMKKHEHF